MGPERTLRSELPSRYKFCVDVNYPPWTDGCGPQETFSRTVVLWKKFHDALPVEHRSKLPESFQGLVLKSALYDQAAGKIEELLLDAIKKKERCLYNCSGYSQVGHLKCYFGHLEQISSCSVFNTRWF